MDDANGRNDDGLTRRAALGAVATTALAAGATPALGAPVIPDEAFLGALGSGGRRTSDATLARLARDHGRGEPVMFVDLAAVDQNAKVIVDFARAHGWDVRPALKVFQSPKLCAYILHLLPEPRGLVFHLRTVDQIMTSAPAGTDLLMGYPPSRGDLHTYLQSSPPPRQRPHRLTLLASSLEILTDMARLAKTTRRRLPLQVALEFDSGEGRGGFHHPAKIAAAIKLLRHERRVLKLRAIVCYDGHATLTASEDWRRFVAQQASGNLKDYLDQLCAEGADLYDAATLIRNGPGSANYRNWAGKPEINEISPGSAFVYAGYLRSGFDTQGLTRALTQAAPVLKDVGPYPSTLFTKIPIRPITGEEYFLNGSIWPDQGGVQLPSVYPAGGRDDEREGGRCMVYAPRGELSTSDYVLCWPSQGGDGIDHFGGLHVVRSGRIVDIWPTFTRWGPPTSA